MEGHDKTPLGLASGFCVSREGFIMTSARTFEGLKYEFEIRARRIDTNNNVKAKIFHVKKEWDMAMLKVEGCDCESGVFVADNAFYYGQPLLCIGHLLHSVGSFRLGRVAFNTEKFVKVPKEEDNEVRCGTYRFDSWDHIPAYRTFGDIWNRKFFKKLEVSQRRNFEFEEQLQPHVPLIHCNGFLQYRGRSDLKKQYGCWGAPIFNVKGEIAGMLVSTVSNFEIGIHVAALKRFKDDAFKKIGPAELSGLDKSADKEVYFTQVIYIITK